MTKKYSITLCLILILLGVNSKEIFCQNDFSAGIYAGGGLITGNSFSQSSFNVSIFVESGFEIIPNVTPRLSFLYAQDFDAILPNTRDKYYSLLNGINLKGITSQYFEHSIFLEEGVGLLALNDRIFSDTNVWDYGTVLSVLIGVDLRDFNLKGIKLGLGIEYGLTFNNTLANYYSLYLQMQYAM
ncbi:MAG TPA: hypothetical protein PKA80_11585 [Ignavibacteriaceae bacterium]|nr:hypothetical protein [Ignavibacteriaceae bacterium]